MRTVVQWLRLVRLPLVFTAIGDAWAVRWMGADPAGLDGPWAIPPAGQLALLAGISACLYGLGMALNDVMDARRDPPGKPIPSGQVPRWAAGLLAVGLTAGAAALARLYGPGALGVAIFAGVLIVAYDAGLKKIPLLGLLLLGAIRAVHCQLSGVAAEVNAPVWISLFLFTHVTVVSWIAYGWEGKRPRVSTAARWGLAFSVVAVDFVLIDLFDLWRVGLAPSAGTLATAWFLALPLAAAGGYAAVLLWVLFSPRFTGGVQKGQMAMRLGLIWLLVYDAAFLASAGRCAGVLAMAGLLGLLLLSSRLMVRLQVRAGLLGPADVPRSPAALDDQRNAM